MSHIISGIEPFGTTTIELRRRMLERRDRIVTSTLTLGELLEKPTELGQASLIEQYDRAVRSTAEVISFDAQVAWRFASVRATHNLRSADAIQLACAAHAGVDLFLTNDKRLHSLSIPGIGSITPLDRSPI